MPRYDYVFVIIEENESLSSLKNSAGIPYINGFLNQGSQFYNYYSTGDPSEPNYLALGGADDWGQTGDEAIPYPAVTGVRANLWNAVDAKGLTWRVYEGSLWPSPAGTRRTPGASSWNTATGGLWFDNPTESAIKGSDGATYPQLARRSRSTTPAVWFADAAAQPDFASNSRSVAGTGTDVNGNPIPYATAATSFGSGAHHHGRLGCRAAGLCHREQHHLLVDR